MAGNPHRYRAALQQLDNRHATAGCLLALLLLLPLASRSLPVAILSLFVLLYVTLVVPVATGFLSATVVIGWLRLCTTQHSMSARKCLRGAAACLRAAHTGYLSLQRLHSTTSQVLFNLAAERLLCENQPGSCLYALLLCSVLGYVHTSLKSRVWSQLRLEVPPAGPAGLVGAVGSLVAARLAKAVVLAFGMISLTERLDRLQPGTSFMLLCSVYFALTQWPGQPGHHGLAVELAELCPVPVRLLGEELQGLEEWWVPLAVRLVAALAAAVLSLSSACSGHWLLAAILLYTGTAVPADTAVRTCWPGLQSQLQLSSRFQRPTAEQLARASGTCAVCLDNMLTRTARATPCGHVFHTRCLRECVNRFGTCPLCKRTL